MSWTLIQSQTLGSSAASVTFSSIPQTYKSLRLVMSARRDSSSGSGDFQVQFNGSGSGYSGRVLYGNGSSAASWTPTYISGVLGNSTDTASTFNSAAVDIPNYANSTLGKPVSIDSVAENNATGAYQVLSAGLWSNTAAITSLMVLPVGAGNLIAGSTFTLYGLK